MTIWKSNPGLAALDQMGRDTAVDHLGIRFTEIGDDFLKAEMPVDRRTVQPVRILHGGASVLLAETMGSVAAYLSSDPASQQCVGLEVNANHLRPVPEGGKVIGICRPLHLGRTTQLWDIRLHDEQGRLCCVSRLTVAVRDRGEAGGS